MAFERQKQFFTDLVTAEQSPGHGVRVSVPLDGKECLDGAQPNTRFFFETGAETIDQARDKADRIKALCGRA